MTRVSIVGAGYVGLVTGVCLADLGHEVVCIDVDTERVEVINDGRVPFHEPGLQEILQRTLGNGFAATSDLGSAVRSTEVTLIAVGTPFDGNQIDLRFVRQAARDVGQALRDQSDYHVVVVKSTVVPGTTDQVVVPELESASGRSAGDSFGVGVNPEFLTEGTAVEDFTVPDRIVVGGIDERSTAALVDLYAGFGGTEMIVTNTRTAEMVKYASNALLATMISFSNELANLGAAVGEIDVVDVMRGVHSSRYLTSRQSGTPITADIASFLAAGCGFGGSCLPKDVAALAALGDQLGSPMPVLDAVLKVNREQPERLVDLVSSALGPLDEIRIAVLGLSFKPDTDDVRESPAFAVIEGLHRRGADVVVHDPVVKCDDLPGRIRALVECQGELETAVASAAAVVIVTRWDEYHRLPELLRGKSPQPVVVDGRRMLSKQALDRYTGIGL